MNISRNLVRKVKRLFNLTSDQIQLFLLVLLGVISIILFLNWLLDESHIIHPVFFWMLTVAIFFKISRWLVEWFHYLFVSQPLPAKGKETQWKVDILTTFCAGEPYEMILNTLEAILRIEYPHETYLCDEADDPILKKFCQENGIHHVTRKIKKDAKAGNINNALQLATGDICLILDPDHVPQPDFLEKILPYFEDSKIGFVQIVQSYYNQGESLIAKGAAEQTYLFYGPIMMGMNRLGTVQAIGANCTFRRAALDSIGGHAAGLAEDLHTSMQLHAQGWKSVYIRKVLAKGLVPSTLSAFYKQQLKWSRGCFELLVTSYPRLFRKFTWRQRIHYLIIPMYYLYGLAGVVDISVPVISLITGIIPWKIEFGEFLIHFIPMYVIAILIRFFAQRWLVEDSERGLHLMGGVLRVGSWWIFLIGIICTLFRIKIPYIPTPKEDDPENNLRLSLPNIIAIAITISAIIYGLSVEFSSYNLVMAAYAMLNIVMLGTMVIISQQRVLGWFSKKLPSSKSVAKPIIHPSPKKEQVL